jgi:hypothetical protein
MKPIRITSPETCACAGAVANTAASARLHAERLDLSLNMGRCLL